MWVAKQTSQQQDDRPPEGSQPPRQPVQPLPRRRLHGAMPYRFTGWAGGSMMPSSAKSTARTYSTRSTATNGSTVMPESPTEATVPTGSPGGKDSPVPGRHDPFAGHDFSPRHHLIELGARRVVAGQDGPHARGFGDHRDPRGEVGDQQHARGLPADPDDPPQQSLAGDDRLAALDAFLGTGVQDQAMGERPARCRRQPGPSQNPAPPAE